MAMGAVDLTISVVLFLSIILVALAASIIMRYNRHFTKGEIKTLGHYVLFAMLSLLGKLLTDFAIQVLPFFIENPILEVNILGFLEIFFVVFTAIFLIRVALLIKGLSKTFGFEMKQ